jgi:restriction system protein
MERFANKQPMHYRAITDKALEMGWLATEGKTPEATMYAQILTEIRRYQKRGEQPRFVQHGKGYVGLSRWMGQGLAFQIEQHNKKVRQALRKRLLEMKWEEFEELIARLLAETGFEEIQMTRRSGDGGIDVRGTLVVGDVIRTRMAVQVKKWKRNVQAPVVQQVRGSLGTHEQGLIITTSDFSSGARKEAARPDAVPVALMNGEQLVVLLVEHSIGVLRRAHDLIEIAESVGDARYGSPSVKPAVEK